MEKKSHKTETHLHTGESSCCGDVPAAELIRLYKEAGYSTVFVTDHYTEEWFGPHEGNAQAFQGKVDHFLFGYRLAKEEGEKIGVTVLLGAELKFGTDDKNDYLIYNITEDTIKDRLYRMTPESFFEYANERGILVIAAHPFRALRRPVPHAVHGLEVINANPRHSFDMQNDVAQKFAEQNPHLLRTGGSDTHELPDVACGGIETEFKISSAKDYENVLRSGNYRIINNVEKGLKKIRG